MTADDRLAAAEREVAQVLPALAEGFTVKTSRGEMVVSAFDVRSNTALRDALESTAHWHLYQARRAAGVKP